MINLTISLVAYKNPPEEIRETLQSALASKEDFRLFFIDNSPSDLLRTHIPCDPRIIYEHLPANPGFGAAHNIGIRKAANFSRYHLILNPDVTFDGGILAQMVAYMDSRPTASMLSPKVFYRDASVQFLCKLLPTPLDVFFRRFFPGLAWTQRNNESYELRDLAYSSICTIPSLSGCFMFARTSALISVGMFDERFFMYFEDVDLTRRLLSMGETLFNPSFTIVHRFKRESYRSRRLLMTHARSAVKYFNKWGWFYDFDRGRINKETLAQFDA